MKFKDTKYGDLTGQTYNGSIFVGNMGLTSLEGAPKYVVGSFNCSDNKLTSLKYAPVSITGYFNSTNNPLDSLKYSPTDVKGAYWIDKSNIKDPYEEIIKNKIKASRYMIDKFIKTYDSSIAKDMESYSNMDTSVKRKGFRTLLGLYK